MQQSDDIAEIIAWGEAELERIEAEHEANRAERNKRIAKLDATIRTLELSQARRDAIIDAPAEKAMPLPGEWQSMIRRLT